MSRKEPPRIATPYMSTYGVLAEGLYSTERPRRDTVYGLVVHTTGSGAPAAAVQAGISVLEWCVARYTKTYGCHYVVGYDGIHGDVIQVGMENRVPLTVGMTAQIKSVRAWNWKGDISRVTAKRWAEEWIRQENPTYSDPLALFPGRSANKVYVGVEMPPCVFWAGATKKTLARPMKPGLRFTRPQHDAIVLLALDLANRYRWPERWWDTGRLVGHEDLSPITRHNSGGGWDPGWLRNDPYFDFSYVRGEIERMSR